MTVQYAVDGMTCDGCRKRVEAALSKLVPSVSVSLSPAVATLGSGVAGLSALNAALAEIGSYRLRPISVPAAATAPAIPEPGLAVYWPLIVIVGFLLLASVAANISTAGIHWHGLMNGFMGGFFLVFAAFKFLDLKGFADAYASYDLLAKRWHGYGFVYPFLEVGLGVAYLAEFASRETAIATIVLMGFSSLGVIAALREKRTIRCACLGTVLALPMSTVTLVEDLGMVAMAALMLIWTV